MVIEIGKFPSAGYELYGNFIPAAEVEMRHLFSGRHTGQSFAMRLIQMSLCTGISNTGELCLYKNQDLRKSVLATGIRESHESLFIRVGRVDSAVVAQ